MPRIALHTRRAGRKIPCARGDDQSISHGRKGMWASIRTHSILLCQAPPEMLELFRRIIWREDVDDSQIIDNVHGVISLVGRPKTALVLVEQEMPSIGRVRGRKLCYGRSQGLGIGPPDGFTHSRCVGNPLDRARFPSHGRVDVRLEDAQLTFTDVVLVASFHVVYSDQQRIVHYSDVTQEIAIPSKLFPKQGSLFWPKLEHPASVEPVEVLQRGLGVDLGFFFRVFSAHRRPLKIVGLVDIAMWREQIVHDDKVNLATAWQLDPMQAVEPRHERMRIVLDVCMVVLKDRPEVLVFGVMDRLDDETVVPREVEEGSRLSWRPEFGQNVFRRQGQ
jgi:hypothetical protein